MQLERVIKSDNFDNLDFDDESSNNDDDENENENKNIDENVILSFSSSNSLISETAFTLTLTSMNLIIKDR